MAKNKIDSTIPEEFAGWDDYAGSNGEDTMYALKEPGNAIQGVIQSVKPGKENRAGKLVVKLTKDCKATLYSGEGEERDSREVPARVGDIVQVDINKALEDLVKCVGREFWFQYKEKIKLDSGGNFWTINGPRVKPGKATSEPDNDIPF